MALAQHCRQHSSKAVRTWRGQGQVWLQTRRNALNRHSVRCRPEGLSQSRRQAGRLVACLLRKGSRFSQHRPGRPQKEKASMDRVQRGSLRPQQFAWPHATPRMRASASASWPGSSSSSALFQTTPAWRVIRRLVSCASLSSSFARARAVAHQEALDVSRFPQGPIASCCIA